MVHKNRLLKIYHRVAYAAGIFAAVVTIPQAVQIWIEKDVSGISLLTWVSYLLIAIVLMGYGIIHRERLIVLTYAPLIIIDLIIVVGIIIY